MNKCSSFILSACAFGLLTAELVEAAPVEWDFVATSCVDGPCEGAAHYPVTVATLTLTGPASTGSASWPFGGDVATYTGDSFAFSFDDPGSPRRGQSLTLTPAFAPSVAGCTSGFDLCDFNLSWTESAGELTALNIQVDGFDDSVSNRRGGLAFLEIESMIGYAPCAPGGACEVAGSWVSSLVTAPEPGSLALLASAFGVWGLIGRRCTRLINPRARFPRCEEPRSPPD